MSTCPRTPGTHTLAPQARSHRRCAQRSVGDAGCGVWGVGCEAHVAEVCAVTVYEHALRTAQRVSGHIASGCHIGDAGRGFKQPSTCASEGPGLKRPLNIAASMLSCDLSVCSVVQKPCPPTLRRTISCSCSCAQAPPSASPPQLAMPIEIDATPQAQPPLPASSLQLPRLLL